MVPSRQCPTRVDHGDSLIAHSISVPLCAQRQREHYHKCYTCVHALNGSTVSKKVALPERPAPAGVTPEGGG